MTYIISSTLYSMDRNIFDTGIHIFYAQPSSNMWHMQQMLYPCSFVSICHCTSLIFVPGSIWIYAILIAVLTHVWHYCGECQRYRTPLIYCHQRHWVYIVTSKSLVQHQYTANKFDTSRIMTLVVHEQGGSTNVSYFPPALHKYAI